jgi:hypothetical protein
MNTASRYHRAEETDKDAPKTKKLDMRLTVTKQDLGNEVKRVFDLAKSSGQDLNLTFYHGTS